MRVSLKSLIIMAFAICAFTPAVAEEAPVTSTLDYHDVTPLNHDDIAIAYLIAAGDVLDISVWKEDGLEREVLVRPDGGIDFPLVGELKAGGKTTNALQAEIKNKIKRYITDAVVTVSLKQIYGNTIYVLGKVARPGEYVAKHYIDVTQALAMAGGLTPYAATGSIKVLRRSGVKEKVFKFDYSDIEDGENLQQNIVLKNGDVVIVP
ncbi:hypothetical protein MNBD_GAMMA24-2081 [hydrothermal vent metagenome]|uniref:Uncharacterized protein n=1 Tax=hydrothermal vent metagenome TaxID=652676 RepID=A0A3B1BND4_9ZZZZ